MKKKKEGRDLKSLVVSSCEKRTVNFIIYTHDKGLTRDV